MWEKGDSVVCCWSQRWAPAFALSYTRTKLRSSPPQNTCDGIVPGAARCSRDKASPLKKKQAPSKHTTVLLRLRSGQGHAHSQRDRLEDGLVHQSWWRWRAQTQLGGGSGWCIWSRALLLEKFCQEGAQESRGRSFLQTPLVVYFLLKTIAFQL